MVSRHQSGEQAPEGTDRPSQGAMEALTILAGVRDNTISAATTELSHTFLYIYIYINTHLHTHTLTHTNTTHAHTTLDSRTSVSYNEFSQRKRKAS